MKARRSGDRWAQLWALAVMMLAAHCGSKTNSPDAPPVISDGSADPDSSAVPSVDADAADCGLTQRNDAGHAPAGEVECGSEPVNVPVPPGCEAVQFESPAIENMVRRILDIPEGPVLGTAVTGIEVLNINYEPVESLVGVECLASLRRLSLRDGAVESLAPLTSLEHLEHVSLTNHSIADLSPLSGKGNLQLLGFSDNRITSLSGLLVPQPPEDPGCSWALSVEGNPIPESEARPFCEQGWWVTWGIVGSETTPYGSCNVRPCRL